MFLFVVSVFRRWSTTYHDVFFRVMWHLLLLINGGFTLTLWGHQNSFAPKNWTLRKVIACLTCRTNGAVWAAVGFFYEALRHRAAWSHCSKHSKQKVSVSVGEGGRAGDREKLGRGVRKDTLDLHSPAICLYPCSECRRVLVKLLAY